jgi:type I restriction enzyme S subunit
MKVNIGNDLYLKGRIGWKGLSKDEYLEISDFRIINGYSLKDGYIDWNIAGYISKERYEESPEIKLKLNDILISKDGTIGKVGIVRNLLSPTTVASGIFVLRNIIDDKLDTEYLFQYLKSPNFKTFINAVKASGSTIIHLYQRDLAKLEIDVPNLGVQKSMAKILFSIDSKIELNNRINSELEAMAKTIYDYWFVQFEFPIEAALAAKMGDPNLIGKPYKTSGGKMVWNEELKREIPEGWEVESIEKSCSIIDCLHSKKSDLVYENQQSYLLQLNNILDNGLIDLTVKYYVTSAEYKKWTTRVEVIDGDIVITNAGRVAATAQIPMEVKAGIGRNITAIRPMSICHTYLFLSFQGADIKRQIKLNTDSGAFFTSFNVKGIKKLQLIRSNKNVEEQFEKMVLPIRRRRELNNNENQKLTELRDWLLPMLMNGQVRVSER